LDPQRREGDLITIKKLTPKIHKKKLVLENQRKGEQMLGQKKKKAEQARQKEGEERTI